MATVWEVVGGAEKGGILVRSGCDFTTEVLDCRLSTGSLVKELEFCEAEGRLHFELISGSGPASGWVTTNIKGKDLLLRSAKAEVPQEEENIKLLSEGSTASGEAVEAVEVLGASSGSEEEVEKGPSESEKEALQRYLEKFGISHDGSNMGYNRASFPWAVSKVPVETPPEALEAALAFKAGAPRRFSAEVDSDGEDVPLCERCFLPVGEFAYQGLHNSKTCVHSECMAQVLVEEAQKEEDMRAAQEKEKKLISRAEYNIGWSAESVPKNAYLAERLGCNPAPQGLCCLVLDEATQSVRVAATQEPAAAVNLEYLLLALKVRKTACREPMFSLDPTDAEHLETCQLMKVYEPKWLAGTSVGDVMFQADYFLKELALGEYTMPVAGMLSVFDWSEMEKAGKEWAGREWFVVKKAEMRLAEDGTLVPHVKMGVEAREQTITKSGLQDKPVTSPDHPLKKFAQAFTRNFDLIAERKSVVFHLRELAKASVMAKYLIDSRARVDASWYDLAEEIVGSTSPEVHPEIPQLWNMRGNSRIQVKDGKVFDVVTGGQSKLQAIYGGVEFGLDRFQLSQRQAVAGGPGMQLTQTQQSGRPMFMPQRFQLQQRGEAPQGVDLNLDSFSLSAPERFAGSLPACSAEPESLEATTSLGKAFLKSLQDRAFPLLKEEDKDLLLGVYTSPQCDRVEEADAFTPPDPNLEYIQKVRALLCDEKSLFDRRKHAFCDKGFVAGNAGKEFPRSWTSRFQVQQEGRSAATPNKAGLVKVDVDVAFQATLLTEILPTAAPEFCETTEDGVVFRIFKIGSLEVRTTQTLFGSETVACVFSTRSPSWEITSRDREALHHDETLQECKVYVEAAGQSNYGKQASHFYVVFQTDRKNTIVTEKLANGATTWVVNSVDLEDRNSLAKLLFTTDCKGQVAASELRDLQSSLNQMMPDGVSLSSRKQYAKKVFKQIAGRSFRGKWGGMVRRYAAGSAITQNKLIGLHGL